VAELAGSPGPPVEFPAGDDAEPDAAAEGDGQEVGDLATAAIQTLREGEGVDVVVDDDRQPEPFPQTRTEGELFPAEHRRGDATAVAGCDHAGHAEPDAEQPRTDARGHAA